MRKHLLLGSAAVLVMLSHGATAQTNTAQTSGSTNAPAATAPSSATSTQSGAASDQKSPAAPRGTPNTSRATTSQATPPASSSGTSAQQPSAARASGSTTVPDTTQNSGTTAANPGPANPAPGNPAAAGGTAQRGNAPSGQAPSGAAAQTTPQQTTPQTPSTQQQATQPNASAGSQQATQPQAPQRNAAGQRNAQRDQAPGGVVSLNVQERTRIGQTIARHNVKPVRNVNFSISVGTAVPRSIQLRALPADLVTFVPQYRGYSYFVVEEQIVIVEPSSTHIVAVIPYSGGTTTRAAVPAPTKSRAVKLSTQERDVIRRHTSARRGGDAAPPARKASRHYSVGDEVETTETIETFPETVYREAPSVRRYRYLRQDDNVILIDPADHRVIDIFD
jgi:uncharacterized protein DUF1236